MAQGERQWQPVSLLGDVAPSVGAYSPAVRAGDMVFVSGQVPRNPRTGETGRGSIEEQTRQVLENVQGLLTAAGASLDDVVSVVAYLANVGDWGKFNDVYKEMFRPPFPSRTAVGASLRGILVEVSVVAYVPRR